MASINLRKLENTVFTVTVTRELRFRLWLGLKLIVLGARITGMEVQVERAQQLRPARDE